MSKRPFSFGDRVEIEPLDPREVPSVEGQHLKRVVKRCRGYENIEVRDELTLPPESRADSGKALDDRVVQIED